MLTIELTKELYKDSVEGYVVLLNEDVESSELVTKIEKDFYPNAKKILKKHKFTGKVGQSFALTAERDGKLVQFIFIGIGKIDGEWYQELEDLRRGIGAAILKLKSLEIESAVIQIPQDTKPYGVECDELVKQMAVAAYMADYKFAKFKSKKDDGQKERECKLFFATGECAGCEESLLHATIIGQAINNSRLLCDMPPNVATPKYISEEVKKIATDIPGLKCAVFGRDKAEELGMGGFLSVDVGSEQDGKFVVLEYNTKDKNAPTIALVGKGVTFDSGGISLKPASHMSGMKFDMSGAAAVIGAMNIIAQLKPNVNVIGLTPLVENMPSGRSNKQDDIITLMNGKTAEIANTDAEGRLILADALCYAEKFYTPDVIIDIATLTGACAHALGHFYTALMTKDKEITEALKKSAKISGDKIWALPFDDDYKVAIKSDVADISNTGSPAYKAGTITSGFFLSNFVEKAKWAHLDIAGTADGVPGVNYLGKGSTGAGVRLLVDFVINYKR